MDHPECLYLPNIERFSTYPLQTLDTTVPRQDISAESFDITTIKSDSDVEPIETPSELTESDTESSSTYHEVCS